VLSRFALKVTTVSFLLSAPALGQAPVDSQEPAQTPPKRYANMPDEAVPYRNFSKAYKEWFVEADTLAYNGAARDRVDEEMLKSPTVNIGFLGPIENNPESPYGIAMLHGV